MPSHIYFSQCRCTRSFERFYHSVLLGPASKDFVGSVSDFTRVVDICIMKVRIQPSCYMYYSVFTIRFLL